MTAAMAPERSVDTKRPGIPKKRPSFISKWLEGGSLGGSLSEHSDIRDLLTETEHRGSSSSFSYASYLLEEDEFVPPPPAPLREISSHFDAWDMTSCDNLSPDEIQAVMIALTAAEAKQTPPSEEAPSVLPPAMCPRNVSVQQLPSVGGPEFLVTVAHNQEEGEASSAQAQPRLTEDDIEWLTAEVAKPTMATRQYSIQAVESPRQSPERQAPVPAKMVRQASVQPLPNRENSTGSAYWVTLPSNSAAVWKVNAKPDQVIRQVSLQRRRPSGRQQPTDSRRRQSGLSFFRPQSRMNGKDLAFVVGPAKR